MYWRSGHQSSRLRPTINKKGDRATNNFRRKDFHYNFTIHSSTTGWSDNCYYHFPYTPVSLLDQKKSTNSIPVNAFPEGILFSVMFFFQVRQQISHLRWVWPRFHTKPLQTALSRHQREAFCSHTLKRQRCYLSRHIFLPPTVQYVILKAVQSVCERDRPSEEPLITWSNAKICQYSFKLWLKMGKWLNKCKYSF